MNHINRLLIKARKAAKGEYRLAIGFVDYDEDTQKYIAKPQPWDGKPGSGYDERNPDMPDWWHSDYQSEEEATEALHKLFDSFGIPENNTVVFLMDYGLED